MCRFFEGMVKLGWTHQVPSTSKYHILIRVISIFLRWFFSAVCLTGPCCERRDSEQRGWQLSTERFLVLIWIFSKQTSSVLKGWRLQPLRTTGGLLIARRCETETWLPWLPGLSLTRRGWIICWQKCGEEARRETCRHVWKFFEFPSTGAYSTIGSVIWFQFHCE